MQHIAELIDANRLRDPVGQLGLLDRIETPLGVPDLLSLVGVRGAILLIRHVCLLFLRSASGAHSRLSLVLLVPTASLSARARAFSSGVASGLEACRRVAVYSDIVISLWTLPSSALLLAGTVV